MLKVGHTSESFQWCILMLTAFSIKVKSVLKNRTKLGL